MNLKKKKNVSGNQVQMTPLRLYQQTKITSRETPNLRPRHMQDAGKSGAASSLNGVLMQLYHLPFCVDIGR